MSEEIKASDCGCMASEALGEDLTQRSPAERDRAALLSACPLCAGVFPVNVGTETRRAEVSGGHDEGIKVVMDKWWGQNKKSAGASPLPACLFKLFFDWIKALGVEQSVTHSGSSLCLSAPKTMLPSITQHKSRL